MARTPKERKASVPPEAAPANLRVVVDPSDIAPVFYVNYVEAANTVNDFSLLCVRLPPKLSDEKRLEAISTKELRLQPDVILTFPTSMVPELIRALTTQKES
jgi:hypothetical protein